MTEPVGLNQQLAKLLNQGHMAPKIEISGDAIQAKDLEVIQFALQAMVAAQVGRIRSLFEDKVAREKFEGEVDARTLPVTDEEQGLTLVDEWPYRPWISVFLINYGPGPVEIVINESASQEIRANETRTITHANAKRRIERLRYKCPPGQTASLKVEGQY